MSEVAADIGSVSPATQVVAHALEIKGAWDFEEVYGALFDFAKRYRFDLESGITESILRPGRTSVQICMFLTEARFFPGRLVQTSPLSGTGSGTAGSYALIDLDLSAYDQIAQRFSREQAEGLSPAPAALVASLRRARRRHDRRARRIDGPRSG